ncbi:conjugative transposon protein TraM [Bacteroides thetaiotaomicron]|nr:conjugative transposon protein TraM [Bacteroides thetaiotaomicron]
MTDSAFVASLAVERNYGFNTAVGSSYRMGMNTIPACISESQTLEQGGRVEAAPARAPAGRKRHHTGQQPGDRYGRHPGGTSGHPSKQHRICREYHPGRTSHI